MLKIFRKLRQNFIVANKIGTYLLYAIGEVILIVIGILLALNISNWNDERKTRAKEEFFLAKLTSNLSTDVKYLNQMIAYEGDVANHLDSILKIVRNPYKFRVESLRNHSHALFSFKRFNTTKTAFDNLVSSGQIDIIRNQLLVEKLFIYYRDVDEQSISGDAALASYSRNTVGPFFMQFDFLSKETESTIRKQKSLMEYHLEPAVENLVVSKLSFIKSQIEAYNNLVDSAEELIKLLESRK
jgi:hypothetical protein